MQQLHQMLDQVADYADDWPECLEMVAEVPETKQLHKYLTYLVPRLKRMQRRFNWIKYDASNRIWYIHNYTYKMFDYLTRKYPNKVVVTDSRIALSDEVLTDKDRDLLRKQR